MSDLSSIFREGAKVVVSPDKMRAWVMLPPPAKGVRYTAEAIAEWLPQHGVVYGADPDLMRRAAATDRYDELVEVARGKAPVAAEGGDYQLTIEKKPFTGLRSVGDGALIYDDLSFLQEVQAGQVLARITPATAAEDGMTVTGEAVAPREGSAGRRLQGSGFVLSEDGRQALAPGLSHVNLVNDKLVVTPLTRLPALSAEAGPQSYEGNVLVEGDMTRGASLSATGSVFVAGRSVSCTIKAGNNVLLSGGMRSEGEFGHVEAKESVWGQFFESCDIKAGGDICANHLSGCDARCGGRAVILGGQALIASTILSAEGGVVAGTIGSHNGSETMIRAGMSQELIDRYGAVDKRVDKLTIEIQALQQNLTAHERVNSRRPDKGRSDDAYKDMVSRQKQSLSVLNILTGERTRLKRTMDSYAGVSVVAREATLAGTVIEIDTRRYDVKTTLKRVKFKRAQEAIEIVELGGR